MLRTFRYDIDFMYLRNPNELINLYGFICPSDLTSVQYDIWLSEGGRMFGKRSIIKVLPLSKQKT